MATYLFADNAITTIAQALTSGSTSITLAAGTGALFPSLGTGQVFTLTLNDAATRARYEVCLCTARSGDVCTVTRGQEGTTAGSWAVGDFAMNAPTSGSMATMVQHGQMLDASIAPVFGATQVDGNLIVEGSGSFIDAGTGGVIVSGTVNGARIQLGGNGVVTPGKTIAAINGQLGFYNNAGAQNFSLSDAGEISAIRSVILPNESAGGGVFAADTNGAIHPLTLYDASNFTNVFTGLNGFHLLRWNDFAAMVTVDNSGNLTAANTINATNANVGNTLIAANAHMGGAIVDGTLTAGTLGITGNANIQGNITAATLNTTGSANIAGTVTGGSVNMSGVVQGASVDAANGNVTANNGRLRATFGAFLSGDPNAAAILNDYSFHAANPAFRRGPDGYMIQEGTITVTQFPQTIGFPAPFRSICFGVTAVEANPAGSWTFGNPTLVAIGANPATNAFLAYCLVWVGTTGGWIGCGTSSGTRPMTIFWRASGI